MKLDYSILISPYPFCLNKVGSIKSPTLKEIFAPDVTYQGYVMYLSILLMTPQDYIKKYNILQPPWYHSLSDEEKDRLSMFDLIRDDKYLQSAFSIIFNFFLTEQVIWNQEDCLFLTFKDESLVGEVNKDNFSELCDIILQRCCIENPEINTAPAKVTSRKAMQILKKLQNGREKLAQKSKADKCLELPNIISSVAVKSNSINFANIWDLTVYQLMEQFKREQMSVYFDIQKMSVAAYGNEKHTFKGDEWFKA